MNWLPPNEMSRQKTVLPSARMLTFMTEAPMLTSADDPRRVEAVVHLVAVLEGEDVDVDEARGPPRLRDDVLVVVDLVLLGGDEEDVHRLPRPPGSRTT